MQVMICNTGDIVIIKHPDSNTQLVKRVAGKAGDTVEIRDSILYINGEVQRESYAYPEPFNDMNPVLVEDSSILVMGITVTIPATAVR